MVSQSKKSSRSGPRSDLQGCFKCADPDCKITLNIKKFQYMNDQLWCEKHVPKMQATVTTDQMSLVSAMSMFYGGKNQSSYSLDAPKKNIEGLATKTFTATENPSNANAYAVNSIQVQTAISELL